MPHASYLHRIFNCYVIQPFLFYVPKKILEDSTIVWAGSGISGIAALFMLKQAGLIQNIAVVRKKNETRHSHHIVEHNVDNIRRRGWVFLDDLMSTGDTSRAVFDAMTTVEAGKLLGAFMYNCNRIDTAWYSEARARKRFGVDSEHFKEKSLYFQFQASRERNTYDQQNTTQQYGL